MIRRAYLGPALLVLLGVPATILTIDHFRADAATEAALDRAWAAAVDGNEAARLASWKAAGNVAALTASAEDGNPLAQATLGELLCAEGQLDDAELWFRRAADQGHPPSIVYLIAMAAPKASVVADPATAAALRNRLHLPVSASLEFAAGFIASCIPPADRYLASWFVDGVLSGWFEDPQALIASYESGGIVEQNRTEALALAIAQDEILQDFVGASASETITRLEEQLSPAELRQAHDRSGEWLRLRPMR